MESGWTTRAKCQLADEFGAMKVDEMHYDTVQSGKYLSAL
jgi:hypothetical protein